MMANYHQMMVPGNGSNNWEIMMYLPYGGDRTYTKLFVGGLPWESKSDSLQRYFQKFGQILEAVVIFDKYTGRSKGYGFVTFYDPEAAKRACVDPNPVIDGRRTNCNLASFGRPQRFSPAMMRPQVTSSPVYQLPFGYAYRPGFQCPPFRFSGYGPEYIYPQMFAMPSAMSTNKMAYGQVALPPSGIGYVNGQGYPMPSPNIIPYNRSIVGPPAIDTNIPAPETAYHSGIAGPCPGQPQITQKTRSLSEEGVANARLQAPDHRYGQQT